MSTGFQNVTLWFHHFFLLLLKATNAIQKSAHAWSYSQKWPTVEKLKYFFEIFSTGKKHWYRLKFCVPSHSDVTNITKTSPSFITIVVVIMCTMMIISVLNIQLAWRTIMGCVMKHVLHTQSLALRGGRDNKRYQILKTNKYIKIKILKMGDNNKTQSLALRGGRERGQLKISNIKDKQIYKDQNSENGE